MATFDARLQQATQNAVAPLYGWLGVHQKAEDNLSGLVLMGARVYNPTTSLFSASDPVYQGNANPYTYPSDPVNQFDLSGNRSIPTRKELKDLRKGKVCGSLKCFEHDLMKAASFAGCVLGSFSPVPGKATLGNVVITGGSGLMNSGGLMVWTTAGMEGAGAVTIATGGTALIIVGGGLVGGGAILLFKECS